MRTLVTSRMADPVPDARPGTTTASPSAACPISTRSRPRSSTSSGGGGEFDQPVLLFSGDKDSIVMLHLAREGLLAGANPLLGAPRRYGRNFAEVLEYPNARSIRSASGSRWRSSKTTSTLAAPWRFRAGHATRCKPPRCSARHHRRRPRRRLRRGTTRPRSRSASDATPNVSMRGPGRASPPGFTGIDSTYEVPRNPDSVLELGAGSVAEQVSKVLTLVETLFR